MVVSEMIASFISPLLAGIKNFVVGLGNFGELFLFGLALILGFFYHRYIALKQKRTVEIIGVTILIYLVLILS